MRPFERSDEGAERERLEAFTQTLWDALVPPHGECVSVQGELIRGNGRFQDEYFRNGMGNEDNETLAEHYFGQMLLFILDTLVENRNDALDDVDVAYFAEMRRRVESDWAQEHRTLALLSKASKAEDDDSPELSDSEKEELRRLELLDVAVPWESIFDRAERCIANWCIANTELLDREGRPVDERGIRDLRTILEPASPSRSG